MSVRNYRGIGRTLKWGRGGVKYKLNQVSIVFVYINYTFIKGEEMLKGD